MLGFPIVIKTNFGFNGIGVHLCNSHHDLKSFLQFWQFLAWASIFIYNNDFCDFMYSSAFFDNLFVKLK